MEVRGDVYFPGELQLVWLGPCCDMGWPQKDWPSQSWHISDTGKLKPWNEQSLIKSYFYMTLHSKYDVQFKI